MTSSSAPPTAPPSEPFLFTDAARLHARRYNKHPLASALQLLSADQRITHPDGGIALLTETGHTVRWTIAFLVTFIPGMTAMIIGLAAPNVAAATFGTSTAVASAFFLAPRCERQVRARRSLDTTDHPWVLSDVATEPHQGIGDQLVSEVTQRADRASKSVVLEVKADNRPAIALYTRHRFQSSESSRGRLSMNRPLLDVP